MSYITYVIILLLFCISCCNDCILLCSSYTELLLYQKNNNNKLQFYGKVANKVVLRTACFLLHQFDMLCACYSSIHAYSLLLYTYHVCRKQNVDSVLIKKYFYRMGKTVSLLRWSASRWSEALHFSTILKLIYLRQFLKLDCEK